MTQFSRLTAVIAFAIDTAGLCLVLYGSLCVLLPLTPLFLLTGPLLAFLALLTIFLAAYGLCRVETLVGIALWFIVTICIGFALLGIVASAIGVYLLHAMSLSFLFLAGPALALILCTAALVLAGILGYAHSKLPAVAPNTPSVVATVELATAKKGSEKVMKQPTPKTGPSTPKASTKGVSEQKTSPVLTRTRESTPPLPASVVKRLSFAISSSPSVSSGQVSRQASSTCPESPRREEEPNCFFSSEKDAEKTALERLRIYILTKKSLPERLTLLNLDRASLQSPPCTPAKSTLNRSPRLSPSPVTDTLNGSPMFTTECTPAKKSAFNASPDLATPGCPKDLHSDQDFTRLARQFLTFPPRDTDIDSMNILLTAAFYPERKSN